MATVTRRAATEDDLRNTPDDGIYETLNPALHIGGHVLAGMIIGPLIGWAIASVVMLITKKVRPTPSRAAA